MTQAQVKRRSSSSERMLDELAAMRVALETIVRVLRVWASSQGQPRCSVDDHIPEAIAGSAKTQAGCRTSTSAPE